MNNVLIRYQKKMWILTLMVCFLLLVCHPALASTAGGGLPYEGWLTKIVNSVSGPVAYAVSVVAMVGAGAGLIFGAELNAFFKGLLIIVLVLSFVIAAKNTIGAITGKGAEISAPKDHTLVLRNSYGS